VLKDCCRWEIQERAEFRVKKNRQPIPSRRLKRGSQPKIGDKQTEQSNKVLTFPQRVLHTQN
jgi:hypothetical protein